MCTKHGREKKRETVIFIENNVSVGATRPHYYWHGATTGFYSNIIIIMSLKFLWKGEKKVMKKLIKVGKFWGWGER